MRIVIPNERPVGWNQFYAGHHWAIRQAEAERVHLLVRGFIKREYKMFSGRVDITINAYFKNKPLDSDNINAKLYIDGLKGKIIPEDNMKHVGSVKTESFIDHDFPRLEIHIEHKLL